MNKQEIARLLKSNRLLQHETEEEVAKVCGTKNISAIKGWETGTESISPKQMSAIRQHYQLTSVDEPQSIRLEIKLQELFMAIYFQKFNTSNIILKELYLHYDLFIRSSTYSVTFLVYELFHYAYSGQYDSKIYKRNLSLLNELENLMTDEEKALYKDMLAIQYTKNQELEQAMELLQEAYRDTLSLETKGLITYHKGIVYQQKGDYSNATESYDSAYVYFSETFYIDKMISVSSNVAMLYHLMNDSETAINKLLRLISMHKQEIVRHPNYEIILENLAWIYTDMKEYSKAKYYLGFASKNDANNVHLIFNYLRISFYENEKETFHYHYQFILNIESKNDEEYFIIRLSEVLNELLESKSDETINHAITLYETYKDLPYTDINVLSDILKELLQFSNRNEDISKLFDKEKKRKETT